MSDDNQKEDNQDDIQAGVDFGSEGKAEIVWTRRTIDGHIQIVRNQAEEAFDVDAIREHFKWHPIRGTVSLVHNGTWTCEKYRLERIARRAESEEAPLYLETWVGRPYRGFRYVYLAARGRVWKANRFLRRQAGKARRSLFHNR